MAVHMRKVVAILRSWYVYSSAKILLKFFSTDTTLFIISLIFEAPTYLKAADNKKPGIICYIYY